MSDILTQFPTTLVRELGKVGHTVSILWNDEVPFLDLNTMAKSHLYLSWSDNAYRVIGRYGRQATVATLGDLRKEFYHATHGGTMASSLWEFCNNVELETPLK